MLRAMRGTAVALASFLLLASCSRREAECGVPGTTGGADTNMADAASPSGAEAGAQDARADGAPTQDGAPAPGDAAGGDEGIVTAAPPTWSSEFVARADQWPYLTSLRPGNVTFGLADPRADDDNVGQLTLPGIPGVAAGQLEGPMYATEIETAPTFRYGTFRARLTLPTCDPSEDAVTGFYTNFTDGYDQNGDGIVDNSEVDIEILCGNPHVIEMAIWTDLSHDSGVVGAAVDLSTGAYKGTTVLPAFGSVNSGMRAELVHPEFPDPNELYEMGFVWQPAEVRFFIVLGGTEVTLWDYTDPQHIPALPSVIGFNVWHPGTHWAGDNTPASYPAHDATTRIDWVRYWQ
jgi:hypothetical protein